MHVTVGDEDREGSRLGYLVDVGAELIVGILVAPDPNPNVEIIVGSGVGGFTVGRKLGFFDTDGPRLIDGSVLGCNIPHLLPQNGPRSFSLGDS